MFIPRERQCPDINLLLDSPSRNGWYDWVELFVPAITGLIVEILDFWTTASPCLCVIFCSRRFKWFHILIHFFICNFGKRYINSICFESPLIRYRVYANTHSKIWTLIFQVVKFKSQFRKCKIEISIAGLMPHCRHFH